MARLALIAVLLGGLGLLFALWHRAVGFVPYDANWWVWLGRYAVATGGLPAGMVQPLYAAGGALVAGVVVVAVIASRAGAWSVAGGRGSKELHGSARWAKWRDAVEAGLSGARGVVVGGFRTWRGTKTLRHDGPEHVMCFAPSRSGKGVALIVPTLLSWTESVLVLDIKGENFALTGGWRAAQGHRVLKFDPAAPEGSIRFNPLAEVRIGTGHDIADCQNIASMIVDPDGKGLKDYWMQEGWAWLSVVILHVLYRERATGRTASLKDVNTFMSGVVTEGDATDIDESFGLLLDGMTGFDHGLAYIHEEVRRGAAKMRIKATAERSGVHSSAAVQLALYADPIVARNIEASDFRLDDLMNGDRPAALYVVIPPSDIDRLRPLVRIVMNLVLRRLTTKMDFAGGSSVAHYRHRLLLMLDEFTSIGKLEIFERSLAFLAGYGLKVYLIVQDLAQLQKEYGRDEAIMSNCHVRVAFAPNKIETAEVLSKLSGRATVVQRKRSRSARVGQVGSVSDSLSETSRPLLTADECMRLKGLRKDRKGRVKRPGDMLVFVAGQPAIKGRQCLYFQDKELIRRARIAPPVMGRPVERPAKDDGEKESAAPAMTLSAYRAALARVER